MTYFFFPLLTFLMGWYYHSHPVPSEREKVPVARPGVEAVLSLILYTLWFFFVAAKLLGDWYPLPFNHTVRNFLEGSLGMSPLWASHMQAMVEILLLKFIPIALLFRFLLGYSWRELGVRWHWGWTLGVLATLVGAGVVLAGGEATPALAHGIALVPLQLALIAFPEELFYRGVLQTRLEGVFKNAPAGLLTAGLLFGLVHLPALVFAGYGRGEALATSLFYHGGAGIFFGLYYVRTRNLGPLILLHAFLNLWGNMGP